MERPRPPPKPERVKMAETKKIQVWPDMVLRETLAAILATIALLLVSMYIDAPLEAVADPATSTNPAKAPWYFLGLQELLVYFPPWIAGVLIPGLILIGLAVIPYIDIRNSADPKQKKFVLERTIRFVFSTGLFLWVALTLVGLFLRGPNWHLQWPDGTPMGTGSPAGGNPLPVPVLGAAYVLVMLLRFKSFQQSCRAIGLVRCLTAHAMVLGTLLILLRIVLYTIQSFLAGPAGAP